MIELSSEISTSTYLILTAVAFAAGFVSAIAGGGGIITLPALLWAGIPPLDALGTNKFQSVFGTLSSTVNFLQKGQLQLKPLWPGLIAAIFGSLVGTWTVTRLGGEDLQILLPILLIAIALYFALSPRISDIDSKPRMGTGVFNLSVGSGVGFYGGFFGPGMGSIYALAFAALLGYNMRRATASTKPLVLATNTTSMILFILGGHLLLWLAISMSVAQFCGARIGSNLVISRGIQLIRPILILTTVAVAVKLLLEA
ncbi:MULTISPECIES: TSUP family transporter [unclassified Microbulbifer]|uniref:Probable membrane transporter protein n=1 Tax=Microbulbifer spongiae TaxID=2944933 RepID=A0ABY9EE64_9GAMM|nr:MULTISPECIES: TSUP family transporter [unclassified Microbulbifer]MDP5208532.1 TSUP family transporter [Microbulbifer sp. 2205BS26-8]WKD50281.1 TSUP family transporter [Microbulbifer sp. MI-G]